MVLGIYCCGNNHRSSSEPFARCYMCVFLVTDSISSPHNSSELYRCENDMKWKVEFEDMCGLTHDTENSCNNVVITTEYSRVGTSTC